ncbi:MULTISPECIES: serine hydrolase [unclassified Psychrobacillus]|uniref:serine hydrolase n=1 Tax=unclassified Psychrobacillus TaxID=2636677 RepID=UPI0024965B05|nr:serine hydrolase [Psychrobacillus sp. NEAU-3TGS]MDI2585720.1 serine hydrolase [Psychrobacillus sp. NEAU-3TGS]
MTSVIKWLVLPMLLVSVICGIPTATKAEDNLNLNVDAAILIDAETGKILYEKNADASLGIASMTKMMTEYLLFEAIESGKITWDQQYSVTDYTYKVSQNRSLSNVPLRQDGTYSIRELYEAMAIYSANAATIAIAETIAGTEENFVKLMNDKAKEMGLVGYKFVNSTGLNNADLQGMHPASTGANDENIMPAKSVAKLAYLLMKDYPEVLETTKIPKKTFREGTSDAIEMSNWNWMLPGLVYEYEGVDGLKTGTTEFAGHSFTGTATRNGMRVIAVVMKAVDANGAGSYKARFDATRALFDYGFSQFSKEEIVPAGYKIPKHKTLSVEKGKEDTVAIAVKEPISMVIKTNEKDLYKPVFTPEADKLEAGIKKGTVVGKVHLEKTEGTDYGYILDQATEVDVVTTEAVERASWISLMFQGIGKFFANLWGSTTDFIGGLF